MSHTPGPWSFDGPIMCLPLNQCADIIARRLGDNSSEQVESNARLIAAAPELLAALENARIALTFYREWMTAHCPEGNESTTYPFGMDCEHDAATAVLKALGNA